MSDTDAGDPSHAEPDPRSEAHAIDEAPADGEATVLANGVRPVDLRDYVDFSPDHATRVRVFATERLALDLWCIEPRQATPVLLLDDQDVTYTVVGGRSWFVTDQGEVGLDPMGSLLVRAGIAHGIDNRAPDPLIVVAASSPPSPDGEDAAVGDRRAAVRLGAPPPGPLRRVLDALLGSRGR